jgi:dihydroflavonol-4-reductase
VDVLKGINRFSFNGGINIADVRDVAKGHFLAAKKGRAGNLYILGKRNIPMEDFFRLVCKTAGFDGRMILKMPIPLMMVSTAFLKWLSDRVIHKPPMSTPAEIAYASQYLYFDNTKAVHELGLTFRPVEDSLQDSISWFRENGYV